MYDVLMILCGLFLKKFMIPKIIHLCWFSEESFPVEIKICLASWKRILPDYTIRLWTYADALAIGCDYVSEALSVKKWAFAADVIRFYAIYKEGGIYMDSDMLLKNVLMNLSRSMVLQLSTNVGEQSFYKLLFDR